MMRLNDFLFVKTLERTAPGTYVSKKYLSNCSLGTLHSIYVDGWADDRWTDKKTWKQVEGCFSVFPASKVRFSVRSRNVLLVDFLMLNVHINFQTIPFSFVFLFFPQIL